MTEDDYFGGYTSAQCFKKSQTDAVRRGIVGDTDTRRTSTEVRRCDVSSWPVNFS